MGTIQRGANGGYAKDWAGTQIVQNLSGADNLPYFDMFIDTAGSVWIAGASVDYSSALNVATKNGQLYEIDPPKEAVSSFAEDAHGKVWASAFICPNAIYEYVTGCSGEIVNFDTTGNIVQRFSVSTSGVGGMTFDKDGNIWFTDQGNNEIAEMSPGGTLENAYPIPTASSMPMRIVLGPGGALWFTEAAANKIGRFYRGTFTEYPLTVPNAQPYDIVLSPYHPAGGGRLLWFSEYDHLGRITIRSEMLPKYGRANTMRSIHSGSAGRRLRNSSESMKLSQLHNYELRHDGVTLDWSASTQCHSQRLRTTHTNTEVGRVLDRYHMRAMAVDSMSIMCRWLI